MVAASSLLNASFLTPKPLPQRKIVQNPLPENVDRFKKALSDCISLNYWLLQASYLLVNSVNALEPEIQKLSDEQLTAKTFEFKKRLSQGDTLLDIQAEAFAVVREAARRTIGMRHFDVQIIGGAVLHNGSIAEMKTGEGKTLFCTLAAYLNALTGDCVHDNSVELTEEGIALADIRKNDRTILLKTMDSLWCDHLANMNKLFSEVIGRFGLRNSLERYKIDGHQFFTSMLSATPRLTVESLVRYWSSPKESQQQISS